MGSGGNNRLLIAAVCAALLVAALRNVRPEEASAARPAPELEKSRASTPPPNTDDYARDYTDFVERLGAFRQGDDAQLRELRASADRLAVQHARHDAPHVVDYYAELTASARRAGLDASEELNDYFERAQGSTSADWRVERPELLRDLERFIARVLAQPDFSAAASALALASEIRTDASEFRGEEEAQLIARAQRDALEALAVFERAGMQTPRLRPMLQIGRLLVLQSRPGDARVQFQACLDLARRCHQASYEIESLVALIRLARNAGDAPELEALLKELAKLCTPEESWELAREHAMLWIHRDEPERAAQFLLRHRPLDPADLNIWRQVLATARVRMGDFGAARELLRRLNATPGRENEDLTLLLATLDLAEGNTLAVLERLQAGGAPLPRMSMRAQSRAAVLIGEAHLREGYPAQALDSLTRARMLAENWEVRVEEAHPSADSSATVLGEWLGLHAVVLEARALCDLGRELDAAVLIERAHGWRWRHAARADQLASADGGKTLRAADLQAWAASYELGLVTWITGANDGLAIHVAPDGRATARSIDVPRNGLSQAVRRFRAALIDGADERQGELGRELWNTLWPASVESALADNANPENRLLLLAHGALERLPFEALPHAGELLDEQVCLTFLPELPTRRPRDTESGQESYHAALEWTLLGNPVTAAGWYRLPAAALELQQLEELLPRAELFEGADFSRDALLSALRSGRALHIATHLGRTQVCASPRFAGIALELSSADSLCAQTIAGTPNNSPLVVLAACETAGGRLLDARGLQGVARAFLDSGTRNLLVTLWPIRDDVAAQFSALYHRALLQGVSPAQAAQLARRALAQAGVAASDWAAYRALGEG